MITTSSAADLATASIYIGSSSVINAVYSSSDILLNWANGDPRRTADAQAYQVSLLVPFPRSLPSSSGILIFTYGSLMTGGVTEVTVSAPGTTSTPVVIGGVVTITNLVGAPTVSGSSTYIGRMFDSGTTQSIVIPVVGVNSVTYTLFAPLRRVGTIATAPSSSIKTYSFNGRRYRPGDVYVGNEGLATSLLIGGTRRLILPPGAKIP